MGREGMRSLMRCQKHVVVVYFCVFFCESNRSYKKHTSFFGGVGGKGGGMRSLSKHAFLLLFLT